MLRALPLASFGESDCVRGSQRIVAAPMRGPWSPRRLLALGGLCLGLCAPSCDGGGARQSEIVSTLARADESLIRTRPALMAGKLVKMASGPYDFFRGTVPLYRHDMRSGTAAWPTRFGLTVPLVPTLGDPHPENFGVLRAPDGSLGLEPNDFDAADRAPYLWDVRRFAAGLALATREANAGDAAAGEVAAREVRAVVRAGIVAYRDAIARRGRGETPRRRISVAIGSPTVTRTRGSPSSPRRSRFLPGPCSPRRRTWWFVAVAWTLARPAPMVARVIVSMPTSGSATRTGRPCSCSPPTAEPLAKWCIRRTRREAILPTGVSRAAIHKRASKW